MWPFTRKRTEAEPSWQAPLDNVERTLEDALERLEKLDADQDYLRLEFKRLRGTVTGGKRSEKGNGSLPEESVRSEESLSEYIRKGGSVHGLSKYTR